MMTEFRTQQGAFDASPVFRVASGLQAVAPLSSHLAPSSVSSCHHQVNRRR